MSKENAQETLKHVINNRYRVAIVTNLLPSFIINHVYKDYDIPLLRLVNYLYLVDLTHEVTTLQNQDNILTTLHQLFEQLSCTRKKEQAEKQASLKALKKQINEYTRLAFKNDSSKIRLVNVDKLKQYYEKFHKEFKENIKDQKYAYITDSTDSTDSTDISDYLKDKEQERLARKNKKHALNMISILVSVIVALGQGLVAAVFMTPALPLILALLIFGIAAFCCNFFLFRRSSFSVLQDLYFGKIWKKEDGNMLSKKEKSLVAFSLIFSTTAALSVGFLSFGSAISAFKLLSIALVGVGANPIGIFAIAGLIAVTTTIALFTIFTHITVSFIRKGGLQKLKHLLPNITRNIIKFYQCDNWADLTLAKKIQHIISKAAKTLFHAVFFLLSVAAIIAVNVAAMGVFYHSSATIFCTIFSLGSNLSSALAYAIAGMGTVMEAIFYAEGTMIVINALKKALLEIAKAVMQPARTFNKIKDFFHEITKNPSRLIATIITLIKQIFLFCCIFTNSYGLGNGPANDSTARSWMHFICPLLQKNLLTDINLITAAVGSAGQNGRAVHEALKPASLFSGNNNEPATATTAAAT